MSIKEVNEELFTTQRKMDVEKFFHMIGGIGDTSYAKNSSLQKKASDMVKHITIEKIREICIKTTPQSIGIADLGCSSGYNTFSIIKDIIDAIKRASSKSLEQPVKEIRVYMNDLPSNDFNSIFKALPDFYDELEKERNGDINRCSPSIFIAGHPGSFYGRLFPNNGLHFIYSSYCLHWLSRVPPDLYNDEGKSINKGNIYISETSPPEVSQAYFRKYKEDFSLFLQSRSDELVGGGGMVLILLGTSGLNHLDRGNTFMWQLLSRSLAILVAQGDIEEEKVDSYDVHFYAPCKNEIEDEVKREGSFEMERFEMFEVERDCTNGMSYGRAVSMTVRAIQESMISHHFGEAILDKLFDIYERIIDEEITIDEIKPITFLLVLQKKMTSE